MCTPPYVHHACVHILVHAYPCARADPAPCGYLPPPRGPGGAASGAGPGGEGDGGGGAGGSDAGGLKGRGGWGGRDGRKESVQAWGRNEVYEDEENESYGELQGCERDTFGME